MDETIKTPTADVAIALIQKDIGYMKESMTRIETTLAIFDRNFARKDELIKIEKYIQDNERSIQKSVDEMEKNMAKGFDKVERDFKIGLDSKVDNKDFDPIKKTLSRINWMLISAVVIGLLGLLIKAGS